VQDKVNIAQPKFFKEVDAMIGDVPIDNWKIYLRWRVVNFASPMLSTAFEQESFDFNSTVLSGTKEPPPLWKRAVSATSFATWRSARRGLCPDSISRPNRNAGSNNWSRI